MGSSISFGGSAPAKGEGALTPVVLNVYDLTPLNNYMHWLGIGIFHSGIEDADPTTEVYINSENYRIKVHGSEYAFGAHEFSTSGVFEVEPKCCPGYLYRCSIFLGYTSLPPSEFRAFLESIASEYHGDTYQLISKNCNHFTDDVSLKLTGKPIPKWVNRLAGLGVLCHCLLPESFRLPAAEQIAAFHGLSEDGSEIFSAVTTSTHDPLEREEADQDKLLSPLAVELAFVREVHR